MSKKLYRTNPTAIVAIERELIDISVKRNNEQIIQSFSIDKLSLKEYNLNPLCSIAAIVYHGNDDQVRFDVGTVGEIRLPKNEPITIKGKTSLTFRIIVSEPGTFKIVAACEGIKTIEEDGTTRDGLIDLEYSSELGERFWDIKLENAKKPVLRVNNNEKLGLRRGFDTKNPFIRGMVLPQAIETSIFYLVMNPPATDEPQHLQNTWTQFLEDRSCEIPEVPEDFNELDSVRMWCRDTALKIANELKFSQAYIQYSKSNSIKE